MNRSGPASTSVGTTTYIAPVVGFDARLALGDHVRLVPGIRLQGIWRRYERRGRVADSPSAGLMWEF